MAILFQSSSNSMLSLKIVLISTSVLSAAVMLKLSAPAVADFAVSEVPSIWNGVVSWLRPPYLYLVINCIIITIVASSKLQTKHDQYSSPPPTASFHPVLEPMKVAKSATNQYSTLFHDLDDGVVLKNEAVEARSTVVHEYANGKFEKVPEVINPYNGGQMDLRSSSERFTSNFTVNGSNYTYPERKEAVTNTIDEFVISRSSWTPVARQDSLDYSNSAEKPPASSRFSHRKNVKSSPEGGKAALGVSKPKRQDTLESTWKTITEGRAMPLTRHLRKSDTWETHGGRHHNIHTPPKQKMNKSETFQDRTTTTNNNNNNNSSMSPLSAGSGKLRKEPSLGQDELNRRVEAFINKFNEEMRMQRQESLNQYKEMINRGAR